MKFFAKALPLLLALCLMVSGAALAETWDEMIGEEAPEISLTCADGTEFILSEVLAEKELAVISLFGSDCGACRTEFPALEMAWRLYQDRVAVVGLSLIRSDDDEVLTAFAQDLGVTFPLGRDPIRIAFRLKIRTYPAIILIRQDGTVAYIETDIEASIDHFVALFQAYLDGDGIAAAPEERMDKDSECTDTYCPVPAEEDAG